MVVKFVQSRESTPGKGGSPTLSHDLFPRIFNAEDYQFSELFVGDCRYRANVTGVHSEKIPKR